MSLMKRCSSFMKNLVEIADLHGRTQSLPIKPRGHSASVSVERTVRVDSVGWHVKSLTDDANGKQQ